MKKNLVLKPFKALPSGLSLQVTLEIARSDSHHISLQYRVSGRDIAKHLVLPQPPDASNPIQPFQKDELWRTTCFEWFWKRPHEEAYFEANFSTDGGYAFYQFDRYREGMRKADLPPPTSFTLGLTPQEWVLGLVIQNSPSTSKVPHELEPIQFGASVILELTLGGKTYWALHHPRSEPDFHDEKGMIECL